MKYYTPLNSGFMVAGIIGFFVSIWLVMDWSETWGFTLALFSIILLIASIVTMSKAAAIPEHMEKLAIHEHKNRPRKLSPKPARGDRAKWYDVLLLILSAVGLYYVLMILVSPTSAVEPNLFLVILTLLVIVAIWFVVEIISSHYPVWMQALLVLLIIVTGPFGLMVYTILRRLYPH